MHSTIDGAPEPRGRGVSITLVVLALVASLVAGGMLYWVTRDDSERKHLRQRATSLVESSPLGAVSRALTPPPAAVTNPATDPNTLSGQQIQGQMPRVEQPGTTASAAGNTLTPPIGDRQSPDRPAPGELAPKTPTPPEQAHTSPATSGENTPGAALPGDRPVGPDGSVEPNGSDGTETHAATPPDTPHQPLSEDGGTAPATPEPSTGASQQQRPHHAGGLAARPSATPEQTRQQPPGVPYPDGIAPKVTEDSVVRGDFITDAAQWLVERYRAGGRAVSLTALNARYGGSLRGLEHQGSDLWSGRAKVLRYAFNAPMLTALYGLYADRFVHELQQAAAAPRRGAPLAPEQTRAMLRGYAGQFAALGAAVQGVAAVGDMPARLAAMRQWGQRATEVNAQVREAVFRLDDARNARNATAEQAAALRLDGLTAQYRRCLRERDHAVAQLTAAIRKAAPNARGVDDANLLYLAAWLNRREGSATAQTSTAAAHLLTDLSSRLRAAATPAQTPPEAAQAPQDAQP